MKIEDLIQMHNRRLEQQAGSDPFLVQRLKAPTGGRTHLLSFRQLRKYALVYGLVFIILTLANIFLIRGMDPNKVRPLLQERSIERELLVFKPGLLEPDYPGSISRAYAEVMK